MDKKIIKEQKKIISFLVIFLLIACLVYFFFVLNQEEQTGRQPEQTVLDKGREEIYDILTDAEKNPRITQVKINPLDVKMGENQVITVYIRDDDNNPITRENLLNIEVFADNGSYFVPAKIRKIDGENEGYTLIIWEGFWECQDSLNNRYEIDIISKNEDDSHHITLTIK
jgi:preprotein translocase subunit YajC